jgi:hypothetical protein
MSLVHFSRRLKTNSQPNTIKKITLSHPTSSLLTKPTPDLRVLHFLYRSRAGSLSASPPTAIVSPPPTPATHVVVGAYTLFPALRICRTQVSPPLTPPPSASPPGGHPTPTRAAGRASPAHYPTSGSNPCANPRALLREKIPPTCCLAASFRPALGS